MSQKYTGGFITKSPVAPTTTAASGIWTLDQQQQAQKAGTWPSPPIFIEDLFSTYLYTGTGASTFPVPNGIDLAGKGGLVWFKERSGTFGHILTDSARGIDKYLASQTTAAQITNANYITSFNSDGYTAGVNENEAGRTFVSWTFRKQPKFFDVVTYTGTGSPVTVNHNLGSTPGCIIIKATSNAQNWQVWHRSAVDIYGNGYLILNSTAAVAGGPLIDSVSSTNFVVSSGASDVGYTYVCYVFAHDAGGFPASGGGSTNGITCGSWTGTGSTFNVDLGYEPQWLMFKRTDDLGDWVIVDNMRGFTTTGADAYLKPNTNGAETSVTGAPAVNATGFSWNTSAGSNFIYIAIRRGPMKTPTVGTSVFSPLTYTGDGTSGRYISGAGFPPDLIIQTARSASENREFDDRLRGGGSTAMNALFSNSTNAEAADSGSVQLLNQDGFTVRSFGNGSSVTYIGECFRRAPSFFDEVCYTGTGSARTITHNLGAVPELMIVKRRDAAANWPVYTASTATNEYLFLNSGGLPTTATTVWNNTAPTSSVFSVGTSALTNASAGTYVAYLFSSCAGVSKVGSYTGTGALQTINCGFTSGARFVLIKLISSGTSGSGDWYVWDSARGISSGNDPYLLLDSTSAEVTGTNYVDTDTTGFKVTAAGATDINASGDIYLFLAIA